MSDIAAGLQLGKGSQDAGCRMHIAAYHLFLGVLPCRFIYVHAASMLRPYCVPMEQCQKPITLVRCSTAQLVNWSIGQGPTFSDSLSGLGTNMLERVAISTSKPCHGTTDMILRPPQ